MDGLTVMFRRWEVRYFPAGQLIQADEPIVNFDEPEDCLLADHPRMRRILVRLRPNWPLFCFYLNWSDGSDLVALDERVSAGTATEADFAGAVVGEAHGMGHRACGESLRVVTLDSTPVLFSDGVTRSRAHAYQEVCPACGELFSANILEFIEPGAL
ncbi:hypothetical protein [Amycolatopsis sp. NPDC001319]|uniref:hypothetical protein n=1 Tax=unclassified Amycolatopsis TaxID=2618356 RepID=UPI003687CE46